LGHFHHQVFIGIVPMTQRSVTQAEIRLQLDLMA
jgi:hypothetical protein